MAKKYPIGVQSFEKIKTGGYVYIDKTAIIHSLIQSGSVYFLSRPRRFGKSLLISTLEAYFLGKKELFKGLAMEHLEKEWAEYPVLYLDFNAERYADVRDLDIIIERHLSLWESQYGTDTGDISFAGRFMGIIRRAYQKTGRKVVVLVDEYDKPLQQVLENEAVLEQYRATFKGFYGVLKSADQYLKFVFMTGVSKFGKISVFSDLNNLKDISMRPDFEALCGITEEELLTYFKDEIKELGEENGLSYPQACEQLRLWYDGYHFTEKSVGLYNPFSLLNALDAKCFGSYWFATGTPTFLVKMLKKGNYNILDVENTRMQEIDLSKISVDSKDPIQILYQTGYLTIKSYDKRIMVYTLGFPNEEVKIGFYNCLAPVFLEVPDDKMADTRIRLSECLINEDVDGFMEGVRSFLTEIAYIFHANQKKPERHFQEIFFILLRAGGLSTRVEEMSTLGRSDIVTETDSAVFVFELKMGQTPEKALQQIADKSYLDRYRRTGKTLYAVGISIDDKFRNIIGWKVEAF